MAARFRRLLPPEFIDQAQAESGVKRNNSLYSTLVVLWLLVVQRLHGGATLEAAVVELLQGLPEEFWPEPCKRLRDWREGGKAPSSNTGAYNQARQGLPVEIVEKACDRIFEQLFAESHSAEETDCPPAFLIDGSSIRTGHSAELAKSYPPAPNQFRESHWPLLKVVVAHDLQTGLAMRPQWGPMHGPAAVSEQALLEQAIDRLPEQATVIADANFGVFSVAYSATQRNHPVVLRMTLERAKRLAGGQPGNEWEREILWTPSRWERRRHTDLPADAGVKGRLLVRRVQPSNGKASFLLAVFTTLPGAADSIFDTYGKRWTIETDIRTLKSSLRLDQLTSFTSDMVAKEIDMGIVAYNLVRALMALASQQSGIPPRGYRFTKVRLVLEAFGPALANAPDAETAQRIFNQMMTCVQQSKHPQRKRKRPSYPRTVWQNGERFPARKK
jgi:Transposase DDE domain